MPEAIVITPVKDSIENTMETIMAIHTGQIPVKHLVYNDFSLPSTKEILEANKDKYGYDLIHLENLTNHPSPNYKLVLQHAQQLALQEKLPLIIVESDVEVKENTIGRMLDFYRNNNHIGLLGTITVDNYGVINFPYLRFKGHQAKQGYIETKKSLSFCCTLISPELLSRYDFAQLNASKDWYDTFLSDQSLKLGFRNILLTDTPVLHKPHGSRPWKQLKYSSPLKYYILKIFKRRDKI